MQREHPRHRAMHSAANLAYADYYQRMIDTGGRPAFAPGEETTLLASGYPLERLERMKIVIEQHHGGGQPAIKHSTMAFHLRGLGFAPNRILSAMVERALYPAYRARASRRRLSLARLGQRSRRHPSIRRGQRRRRPSRRHRRRDRRSAN